MKKSQVKWDSFDQFKHLSPNEKKQEEPGKVEHKCDWIGQDKSVRSRAWLESLVNSAHN